MLGFFKALFTDSRCICITNTCIEIALVDSLVASCAVHVLKIVDFLSTILNLFLLQATKDVVVTYPGDFSLALRTRVLHVWDPALYTRITVFMLALIKKCLNLELDHLEANTTGFLLLFFWHLCHRLSIRLNCLSKLDTAWPSLLLVARAIFF